MTLRHANIGIVIIVGAALVFYALRMIFQTPTVEVQAAWTTAGIIGTIITAINLRDALHDKAALRDSGRNGNLGFMAEESIRVEILRLSKMVAIVIVGVVILTSSPTITAEQRAALHIPQWSTTSIIVTAGLLWVVTTTVIQSALDMRVRHRFYNQKDDPK